MTDAAASAKTTRYAKKREAILHAAARLLNQNGLKGATLSGVAAEVGLITTSVTYYFRRKEDLAAACFSRTIETLTAIARTAETESGPEARLRRFLSEYMALLARIGRGEAAELVNFHDLMALTGPHAKTVRAEFTDLFRQMRALLLDFGSRLAGRRGKCLQNDVLSLCSGPLWVRMCDVFVRACGNDDGAGIRGTRREVRNLLAVETCLCRERKAVCVVVRPPFSTHYGI